MQELEHIWLDAHVSEKTHITINKLKSSKINNGGNWRTYEEIWEGKVIIALQSHARVWEMTERLTFSEQ